MSTSLDEAKTIFLQALEIANPKDRDSFVASKCNNDEELRAEVHRLLDHHADVGSFMDSAPADCAQAETLEPVSESPGDKIGPYKLREVIGEGGMGTVFVAEQQQPIRRKVALKVIKPGMDSKAVLARFDAERQALALMSHANIAQVLDAGTTEKGRPYFVMELIKGQTITEYCDARKLSVRERLDLFSQVCNAVQHAHQKGVIHRDIKPNNILVTEEDGRAIPKIIDFGVAKALNQSLTNQSIYTNFQQVVGTPLYMSPEQASLSNVDVDTSSDVYSLGILLYELLTGTTPLTREELDDAAQEEWLRRVREQDAPRPSNRIGTLAETATRVFECRSTDASQLGKSIRGDLDWIVMKAIEKDRHRRYRTADAFAADVQRHLSDEPVEARPPSTMYRLSRFYRRNKAATLSIGTISAVLLVGLLLTTTLWQAAVAAGKEAEDQRQIAEQETETANRVVKQNQAILDLFKTLLSEASPKAARGLDTRVGEMLDDFEGRLEANPISDPVVELEIRTTLAAAYDSFANYEKATAQYEQAERMAKKVYAESPARLIAFFDEVAWRRIDNGQQDKAFAMFEAANELAKKSEVAPDLRVSILIGLGNGQGFSHGKAKPYFEAACEIAGVNDEIKKNPFRHLARTLRNQNYYDQALTRANRSLEFVRRNIPEDSEELILSLLELAECQQEAGNIEEANATRQKAIATSEKSASTVWLAVREVVNEYIKQIKSKNHGPHPSKNPKRKEQQLTLLFEAKQQVEDHWNVLFDKRRVGALVGRLIGEFDLVDNVEGRDSLLKLSASLNGFEKGLVYYEFGNVLRHDSQLQRADELLAKATDFFRRADGTTGRNRELAWTINIRSRSLRHARNFSAAEPLLRAAIQILENEPGEVRWSKQWMELELAMLLEKQGKFENANPKFEQVLEQVSNAYENMLWGRRSTRSAYLLAALKSDSKPSKRRAVEQELRKVLSELPSVTDWLDWGVLGLVAEQAGNQAEALNCYAKGHKERRISGLEQLSTEWISAKYIKLMQDAGKVDELVKSLGSDIETRDEILADHHMERAFARLRLAEVLVNQNRDLDEAKVLLTEARRVFDFHGEWIPQAEHAKVSTLMSDIEKAVGSK